MVTKWLGMRELQARRGRAGAETEEGPMANREQKGNREKRKPKKEKPKDAPAVSAYAAQFAKPGKRK